MSNAKQTNQMPEDNVELQGSERHPAPNAKLMGPADPDEVLSVTIRLRRKPGAPSLPALPAKASPNNKFLTPDEFKKTYGAASSDIEQVVQFAEARGLAVIETNAARRTVIVSGKVKQMNQAFGVKLGRYQTSEETYRGREGKLYLPENLHEIVEGVFGLDNRRMARRAFLQAPDAWTGTAKSLTPLQVAELYQFPTPLNAVGQTIGLLEFGGGYTPSDITSFFNGLKLPPPSVVSVGVNGATNSPGNAQNPNLDDQEVTLDIDVSGSIAQGAEIAVYFSTFDENGWVQALTTAIFPNPGQPAPSVLSISWGWDELQFIWTQAAINAVSGTFEEAAALGITVLVAAGDLGSSMGFGDGHAHVWYPGSDPWVTSCGGTIITNVNGSSFTEQTWQDGNGWATAGGVSDFFIQPPQWQSTVNLPPSVNDGHKGRTIPDVSGQADPASAYTIILYGQPIVGGGNGTSSVAPLYAGLVAVLNARLRTTLGFLNPTLYLNPSMYNDIADGVSNSTDGVPGYTSVKGYDACTGWGSINGAKLLAQLSGITPRSNRVAVGTSATGELQAVYLWADDLAYLVWQDNNGGWHPYGALPNPTNTPYAAVAVGSGNSKYLQVGCLGRDDGQPYLIWQNENGVWANFGALPNPGKTPYSAITSASGAGGDLLFICIGSEDGQPYLISQNSAGAWSNAGVLPNPDKTPYSAVAAAPGSGGVQIICIGKEDGQPYLIWQDQQGAFSYYGTLPNPNKTPYSKVVARPGNGNNLQVVLIGENDGQPYLIWQNQQGGAWNYYGILPNPNKIAFSELATGVGSGDNFQLICIGKDNGQPYLIWQNQQGVWIYYGALPNPTGMPFYKVAAGTGNGSNLQVVCLSMESPTIPAPPGTAPSGQPYLIWQNDANGVWSSFGCLTAASIAANSLAGVAQKKRTRKVAV